MNATSWVSSKNQEEISPKQEFYFTNANRDWLLCINKDAAAAAATAAAAIAGPQANELAAKERVHGEHFPDGRERWSNFWSLWAVSNYK